MLRKRTAVASSEALYDVTARVCFCLTESVTSMWSPWKTTVLKFGQCISRARRGGGK